MKTTKKILSLMLAVLMCFSCMLVPTYAATSINYSPYPKVEYSYSSGVSVGTIRYIAQNSTSPYFNWNYWPRNSFGGYGSPESECGTACISMALSYVGVDRTPKVLLESTNGYTGSMWGQQGNANSKSISKSTSAISNAMNDYINGNGKYSPLCVYIVPFSSTSSMHWVLLVGKIDNNKYLALNPWHTSGTNGTFTIQINGTTATYNGTTNPISSVNQWYNPNASIPSSDTKKPTISNVKVSDLSSRGYTVTCNVSDNVGVTRVAFPTWTHTNGQDDLLWKDGVISGNTATFTVKSSEHKNESGLYATHIYAYDAAGNSVSTGIDVTVPKPDTQKPSISNVRVTDVNESGFTISCNVSDNIGIKEVLFPVWTSEASAPTSRPEPGQDDIIYHKATISGNTATCRINIADHNNSYGEYFCDPHIYDTSGNMIISSRVVINVPKFVANCERLASLGTYDVSKNDSIEISIWAFNLTGDEVDCYYQIDSGQLVYIERGSRPDVVRVYPECTQVDCGFGLRLDASIFSEGTHNIKILAKSNGAEQNLFENNFIVVKPTFVASFNANGGSCSASTKSVKCGNTYGTLPTPTRSGYTFDGWYTSVAGGTKVTSSTKVTATSNHTLYAHWTCKHSSTEVRNAKTATCTAEGYTGDTYCKTCVTKTQTGTTTAKKTHTEVVDNAVSATCSKTGLTEGKHCSICNTVIVAQQTVATVSHVDTDGDYKCDYNCGYEIENFSPDDTNKDCSCMCHKSGLIGIIWKILRFIYKLFKINTVCGCGVYHY